MKIRDIAEVINISEKNPRTSGIEIFVGLEHYDIGSPVITRFGSTKMLSTAAKRFESGDVLIARRNVYLQRAGKVYFSGLTSGDSIVLRAKETSPEIGTEKELIELILPFILNTNNFWNYANVNSDGTMSKRLSPELLLDYEFSLPDKDIQRHLAEKLWAAYELKQSYIKMIAATDEMVKSQFIEMFGQQDKDTRLGDCFHFIRNGANIKQGSVDGGYPITRIETISTEIVNRDKMGYAGILDDKYSSYYLSDKDILISHINSLTHIGKCALYRKEGNETIIHGMNLLCARPCVDTINPTYFIYLMRSPIFKKEIRDITKPAVNQASFTVTNFSDLRIPLPTMNDQITFEKIVEQADKSKYELKQSIAAIDKVIKSLINENI